MKTHFPSPGGRGLRGGGMIKRLISYLFYHPHLHPPPSRGRNFGNPRLMLTDVVPPVSSSTYRTGSALQRGAIEWDFLNSNKSSSPFANPLSKGKLMEITSKYPPFVKGDTGGFLISAEHFSKQLDIAYSKTKAKLNHQHSRWFCNYEKKGRCSAVPCCTCRRFMRTG
jgi:hypothetical protein